MKKLVWFFIGWIGFQALGCIEGYAPPEIQSNDNYLVVEGYLNTLDGSCSIMLSRTVPLSSEETPERVTDASLFIEDESSNRYIFTEYGNGIYKVVNINVDFNTKYRLVIRDGSNEYTSDYVDAIRTPPVESVKWRADENTVKVFVNTNGSNNDSQYYMWRYIETWEYNSAFRSFFKFENGDIFRRNSPDEIYYCWKTDLSSKINVGSTTGLEQNVISDYLLRELSVNSRQFQSKYSILVLQYSLTKDAHEYWSQVRDNTQGTGSLFDVQPSRVTGNIYDLDKKKPALGFFSAHSVQEKRIFIDSDELPILRFETGYEFCAEDTLLLADIPSFEGHHEVVNELIEIIDNGPRNPPIEIFLGYTISSPFCVDCRVMGGVNERPVFWE